MARKLASYVFVDDAWYGPDDSVPASVAKKITNESAWAEGDEPAAEQTDPAPKASSKSN